MGVLFIKRETSRRVRTSFVLDIWKLKSTQMPEKIIKSDEPLRDGMKKITEKNLKLITGLKIAKSFSHIGYPIVGFEGKDKYDKYFELRVDKDEVKGIHVNVTIDGDDTYAFVGKDRTWHDQVINNINGGQYCDIPFINGERQADGKQKDPQCIEAMKRYMRLYL